MGRYRSIANQQFFLKVGPNRVDQGTNTRGTNILNDTSNATDNEFCNVNMLSMLIINCDNFMPL